DFHVTGVQTCALPILFDGVIEDGLLHSQPFSEGLSGRATTGVATVATPVDGGFRITGRKIFASLSDAADVHNVVALVPGDPRIQIGRASCRERGEIPE